MLKKVVVYSMVGLLIGSVAMGAEPPDHTNGGIIRLEEMVVTATRTEHDLGTAPGSIAVVTNADMTKRNVTTFDEALNTIPGVVTSRGKGLMDGMSTVTLRGLPGQNRTLIMVDGITLNSPYSGFILSNSVSPGSLERIEVVKGASSSLYGGYAMGGVINMITEMPTKREFTLQTGFGSALDGAGAKNTRQVAVSYGDSFKDSFRISIYNDYLATDGYRSDFNVQSADPGTAGLSGYSPSTDAYGTTKYLLGDKGKNGSWRDNLTIKTVYTFSADTKLRFTFMKSVGGYDYKEPQTYLKDALGNETWENGTIKEASFLGQSGGYDQYLCSLGLETHVSPVALKMTLGFMDQASSWAVTPNATTATRAGGPGKLSSTPGTAWNADLQATLPVYSSLLTLGGAFRTGGVRTREFTLADWRNEHAKGALTYETKGSDRTFALFAQDEIVLADNLTAYVGFRQDWWQTYAGYANQVGSTGYPRTFDSRSDTAFSPKTALVFKPFERTTMKVSGGRAFRAPTVYELYRTWTTGSGVTYNSNPDLKAETSTSWDASITQGLWQGASIKSTYFENYIKDLIYSRSVTATSKYQINAGKGESKGIELEAEQLFGTQARIYVNYTHTAARVTANSAVPASVGKRMTSVPEHMFNAGSDIELGPFGAAFIGRYVGKRYGNDTNSDTARDVQGAYDPYFTADIKLRYKLTAWATATFSVNNLFDEQYYSYSRAPGRSCYGDVTFRF
jgi:iron complex outermembrane receptor protein